MESLDPVTVSINSWIELVLLLLSLLLFSFKEHMPELSKACLQHWLTFPCDTGPQQSRMGLFYVL